MFKSCSIKYQLLVSYSAISIISSVATLLICYALLSNLGNESYKSVKQTLDKQSISSAITVSNEISYAIEKQLSVIGQSFSMAGVLYSNILLNNTKFTDVEDDEDTSIFLHQNSYKEYNFKKDCTYPDCPDNFGLLSDNERYPSFLKDFYGSLNHTSVYLYSNDLMSSVRDDITWEMYYNSSSALRRVVNGLVYKDDDFKSIYSNTKNQDIMFYLTVKIESQSNSNDYLSVRRTYPGIEIDLESYDPTSTEWFENAPVNTFDLSGPYKESYINATTLFISSKSVLSFPNYKITIVDSAVFLINAFTNLMKNLVFPDNGFGALLKYDTLEVIVWGNNSSELINSLTNELPTVYSYEPNININEDLRSQNTFYFTDSDGIKWLVTSNPLLKISHYGDSESFNSLILLVFSKLSSVQVPLSSLRHEINHTTTSIITEIIIISVGVLVFNLVIIYWFVNYFVLPLEMIRQKSLEIVDMSLTEDDNVKDYSVLISNVTRDYSRRDEVGFLAIDYIDMITALNAKHLEVGKKSSYIKNPFYLVYQIKYHSENSTSDLEKTSLSLTWNALSQSVINHFDESSEKLKPERIFNKEELVYINKEAVIIENFNIDCQVQILSSTKTKLAVFSMVILGGLIAIMIITFIGLYSEGGNWISSTKDSMVSTYKSILDSLAYPKAAFSASFFNQIGLECAIIAAFMKSVMTYKFTTPQLINQGRYLQSYSIDPYNPYVSSVSYSVDHSVYFSPSDKNCTIDDCGKTHNSTDVKVSSLWDIRTKALLYPTSSTLFYTLGTHTGILRDFPVTTSTKYSHPVTCFISNPYVPVCQHSYTTTSCDPSYAGPLTYPVYDPRCRNWYFLGFKHASSNLPYYLPPSITVQGYYAVYSVVNILNDTDLLGVQLSNVDFQEITNAVNQLKLLTRGYCYIISAVSPWTIISHPFSGTTCSLVECAESKANMSPQEYTLFNETVLSHINNGDFDLIPSTYIKNNEIWALSLHTISVKTFPMILIVTVPQSDITEPVNGLNRRIDTTLNNMIIAFVFAIFAFFLMFFYMVSSLINNIVVPINQLRGICVNVINNEEIHFSQIRAYSLDMEILLNAFSNLLDIFQSGYDSFIKQDYEKSKALFSNSLNLFQSINNLKNMAISENNLGCVELTIGNYQVSEFHFNQSIRYYLLLIQQLSNDLDKSFNTSMNSKLFKLLFNLNQVYYNKCLLHLSTNQMRLCYKLIQNQIEHNININNIIGVIYMLNVKGQYYFKSKQYVEANETLNKAFKELKLFEDNNIESKSFISSETIGVIKQLTLYNLAVFYNEMNKISDIFINENVEYRYMQALALPEYIDKQITNKIFQQLSLHFVMNQNTFDLNQLNILIEKFSEDIPTPSINHSHVNFESKRVIFCLDYSLSMSLNNNLNNGLNKLSNVLYNNINYDDEVMLMHYNESSVVDITFTNKKQFISKFTTIENSLHNPAGKSYLYDSINDCIDTFGSSTSSNDWIIVFCGGGDEGSTISIDTLNTKLLNSNLNLVIVSLFRIKETNLLDIQSLTLSTSNGLFIHSTIDIKKINQIFGNLFSHSVGVLAFQDC